MAREEGKVRIVNWKTINAGDLLLSPNPWDKGDWKLILIHTVPDKDATCDYSIFADSLGGGVFPIKHRAASIGTRLEFWLLTGSHRRGRA